MEDTDNVCRVTAADGRGAYDLLLPDAATDYLQKLIADTGRPYEEDMLRDMSVHLEPGELVLDVGANIGNHAIYLAALAGARVTAFEPNGHLADTIRRSVSMNGLEHLVEVRQVGVGRSESRAQFSRECPENLGAQSLDVGAGDIAVVSLDQTTYSSRVRAIKVDVEGMELDVLEGAEELVARDRPLLYVESQDEASFKRISRWMINHGYSYWETFNVTPTHLYRPVEECSVEERVERLMSREVLQEYRYNLLLRRARRFQRAAEQRVSELEQQITRRGKDKEDAPAPGPVEILSAIAAIESKVDDLLSKEGDVSTQLDEARALVEARATALAATLNSMAHEQQEQLRHELVSAHTFRMDKLRGEHDEQGRQLRHVRRVGKRLNERIRELEESTAFRLGLTLVEAATSVRGALKLPVSLGRLFVRALRRRLRPSPQLIPAEAARKPLTPQLLAWVQDQPKAAGAVSILYADISLNVVDGSSVWLSSMASLLCSEGPCILVAKLPVTAPVVLSNVRHAENLVLLEPSVFEGIDQLQVADAIQVIRELDGVVPTIRRVVVRGLDAASLLFADRQFAGRAAVYLTDFYSVSGECRQSSHEQERKVKLCVSHAETVLVQTREIGRELERIGGSFNAAELPPVVPDGLPAAMLRTAADDAIRIGYAGKVNSRWGVIELLDWAERAVAAGLRIELHIVANRISNGPEPGYENLRTEILERINRLHAHHYTDFNREASIALMSKMDFVWCYRPARFEDTTIELSTKLVETAAFGARCICYPSEINIGTLGEDYPFFVRGYGDFLRLLTAAPWPVGPRNLPQKLLAKHGFEAISARLGAVLVPPNTSTREATVVVAGHDMKFINAWVSMEKADGSRLLRDTWEWGHSRSEPVSEALRDRADIVFCEWGLANAVWASRNKRLGTRLVVRVHAQEVRARARRFGAATNAEAVDAFVFVSDEVRRKALELWGWPEEKTIVVPNYVLDQEFSMAGRSRRQGIVLGMVGIVPTLKRFDRALDVLATLREQGVDVRLKVKGHRPEDLEFMRAPGRREELEAYTALYDRIENDPLLSGRVEFAPWGNDIAAWYKGVDVILSCSETESFHYALADGVLSGCFPVVWPWEGAAKIYSPGWIVDEASQACTRILGFMAMSDAEQLRMLEQNRALIVERYGFRRVSAELHRVVYGEALAPRAGQGS